MNRMKRVEANDPVAMCQMGVRCKNEGDYDGAFEYWTKAAGLGDVGAHYNLSVMHREGLGVEKNKKEEVYHLEKAAIGGHTFARHNLGIMEGKNGRHERAMKHFIIAAKLGDDYSLLSLRRAYAVGFVSKEDFASALRAHQAALDAMKSPQREKAEAFLSAEGSRKG
eukprot:CAMPEP_0113417730 /NCGR_PEP_ID=MMETSP0013_2-20120614/25809_1 /TAXON_ID=2843 ORGANISM="Skeletonema costatum, Strain 1716" /NCGR_SAMPLE_ID=MMETSP0013_2 /ASSEMBLY_ACC=CAM_ASM_000158 /LENGTH=166 /DNA_ID=CAMNT_0000304879 /DNA_START=441 /DNA_END=938 /DNA_ORIENTATION=+ /assembly_acc=CAM_ASM_000158